MSSVVSTKEKGRLEGGPCETRDTKVRLKADTTYYLWVIGTFSSPSFAIMSSADVAGFTCFSM